MLTTFAVLLALVPQGGTRGAGRVLDHSGTPVVGATVTFLSRPIPRSLDAGPEDRRVVQTDERGSFRVELERGARYTVWAGWDDAASAFAEGIIGGEFLELRGAPGTGPVELDLTSTTELSEEWPEADSFRLRAIVGGENIDFVELEKKGAGRWLLPALPLKQYRTIEVLDARGEVLWADAFTRAGDGVELRLPPPREFTVEVQDENGQPVAGVDLLWHIRNYWYSESESLPYGDRFRSLWPVVATTDAKGGATVRVPWPARQKDLWLLSRKGGYTLSLDGIHTGSPFSNGKVLAAEKRLEDGTIRVILHESAPVDVPLADDRDTALADQWLFLVCRVHVSRGNGAMGTPFTLTLPVTDGRARMTSPLPPGAEVEIAETMLADRVAKNLREQHGFSPRRVWRLPRPDELLVPDAEVPFVPGESRVLQVTAADGRPASSAVVLIADRAGNTIIQRTDRLGRTLLSAERAARVGVAGAHGIGATVIEVESEGAVMLQLQAMAPLSIRVIDAEGNPVAGAGVRVNTEGDPGSDLADLLWCASAMMGLRPAVTSNAKGRLEVLVPPIECLLELGCDRRLVSGKELEWDPERTGVHELVVESRD